MNKFFGIFSFVKITIKIIITSVLLKVMYFTYILCNIIVEYYYFIELYSEDNKKYVNISLRTLKHKGF